MRSNHWSLKVPPMEPAIALISPIAKMARAKAVLAIFAYKRRLPLLQGSRMWYNLTAMKNSTTQEYITPFQYKIPQEISQIIEITDPVYTFSEVMAHIDLRKHFAEKGCKMGRPRCDAEKLLKVILFAFMEEG